MSVTDPLGKVVGDAVSRALDLRHRGMLIEAAIVSAVIGISIALPLTLVLNASNRGSARQNSVYTCKLVGALSHIEAGFIKSDARDRQGALTATQQTQVLGGLRKIFGPSLIKDIRGSQQRLDHDTIAYWQGPVQHRGPYAGQEPLLAQTRDLARVNCSQTVR